MVDGASGRHIYDNLPQVVKSVMIVTNGWLVGGAPLNIISGTEVKDYDIIVESREDFAKIVTILKDTHTVSINAFGGLKVDLGEHELDIWCETLTHFLRNAGKKQTYIYSIKFNQLLKLI